MFKSEINIFHITFEYTMLYRPFGYKKVYLPLCRVADTPFKIQGDELWACRNELILTITSAYVLDVWLLCLVFYCFNVIPEV